MTTRPPDPATDHFIATFATFEDAVRARDALLAGGLAADEVSMDTFADEAGPVEGNFLVGNGRAAGSRTSRPHLVGGTQVPPYRDNFGATVERGWHVVRVRSADAARREHARTLLAGFDATVIEE